MEVANRVGMVFPVMLLLYRVSVNLHCAVQVAQGVLDHMNSVLGSSEHQHRRSLQELLSLYAIATPSLQDTPGASGQRHAYIQL